MGEAQVLVGGEHSAGQQVGLAHVVEEAAHVAVETGVDAVEVLRLVEETVMTGLRISFFPSLLAIIQASSFSQFCFPFSFLTILPHPYFTPSFSF